MPLPAWMHSQLADRGIRLTDTNLTPAGDDLDDDKPVGLTPCPCHDGCPDCDNTGVIYP